MKKVLAVDDSATMRSMVCDTLTEAGFEVCTAGNGKEALELARTQNFQLVLTDVNMPEMDGISLVRELRTLPNWKYIPILVLTTETAPELKRQGKVAGATGWLVKPFDPVRLIATIRRVLL
jgi:two-component system chemotaxis response regulator CheY